ncbi:MAG: hypothetical protein JWP27_623 [Flaviaesturariibacter sp.]|nr:hypothetical protein [Flaviaesturariibacter sp.]
MSAPDLQALYLQQSRLLHQGLLNGTSWRELQSQRKFVSAIGVAIDRKMETYTKETPQVDSPRRSAGSGPRERRDDAQADGTREDA